MTTLKIKNAVKRYPNGALAVKGVSVDVKDGELVVFVGPSGCGKSTLLRMVAGLEEVTEGDIELAGVNVEGVDPASSCPVSHIMPFTLGVVLSSVEAVTG